MNMFLVAHQNYSYENLFLEIEDISMHVDEPLEDFYAIFMSLCFRFYFIDLPSKKYVVEYFTSLVHLNYEYNKSKGMNKVSQIY